MSYIVVTSARDRAASGRSIATALSSIMLCMGLVAARLGMGVPIPIAAPPAVPGPVVTGGGDHQGGGGHRLLIPADAHGSCYVDARVNGTLFKHDLLDSGASGYLAFGRNHAAALGIDPDKLSYDYTYGSANGYGHEAIVRVSEFRLGSFVLHNVQAEISQGPQDTVLIGIQLLHRLALRLIDGHCELRLP